MGIETSTSGDPEHTESFDSAFGSNPAHISDPQEPSLVSQQPVLQQTVLAGVRAENPVSTLSIVTEFPESELVVMEGIVLKTHYRFRHFTF